MPSRLVVHPLEGALSGSVPVPSDKSIGHRAVLFGALASGPSRVRRFSRGEDNVSTLECFRAMGVRFDDVSPDEIVVHGVGLDGLREPTRDLDCGNSGTTMRLLTGLLAAQRFRSVLVGDASLSGRPMGRVVAPLRQRGAVVDGRPHPKKPGDLTAPLVVGPLPAGARLAGLEYSSPVASAQVKSALLLAGLYADGPTVVSEPSLSRDHTERMLAAMGAPLSAVGAAVRLDPAGWARRLEPFEIDVPGDLSAAAFVLVAAATVPGSRVSVRDVGVNPTRTGILEILRDMGVSVVVEPRGDRGGEPLAHVHAEGAGVRAARLGGETVTRAIDEVPIACALAAAADGTTSIRDAKELRVKESDRLATMAEVLRAFGVEVSEVDDGLDVTGRAGALRAADVESKGDHRIAMTAAVLALRGDGPSVVRDAGCIATSFPRFVGTLRALGARVDVEEG